MSSELTHILNLFFSKAGITKDSLKRQYSIKLNRLTGDKAYFEVLVRNTNPQIFIVTKKPLNFDNLLSIPASTPRAEINKYFVASVVSQYTKGFNHNDVGLIDVKDDHVNVYINPASYLYTGQIKIRRA